MTTGTQAPHTGAAGSPLNGFHLVYDHEAVALPEHRASDGPAGLDVRGLLDRTGRVTLDFGYGNTASCTSAITYIDGDAGILRYRGYPIEQLAEHSTFLEVAYLLFYGELPTSTQLHDFT